MFGLSPGCDGFNMGKLGQVLLLSIVGGGGNILLKYSLLFVAGTGAGNTWTGGGSVC